MGGHHHQYAFKQQHTHTHTDVDSGGKTGKLWFYSTWIRTRSATVERRTGCRSLYIPNPPPGNLCRVGSTHSTRLLLLPVDGWLLQQFFPHSSDCSVVVPLICSDTSDGDAVLQMIAPPYSMVISLRTQGVLTLRFATHR
uniref:Uncharacterized protein n=1 Tax=Anopheles arabiensis TaxID=7173 RepID=A0A182IF67_ANOAR